MKILRDVRCPIIWIVVVSLFLSSCANQSLDKGQVKTTLPVQAFTPVSTLPVLAPTESPTVLVPFVTPTIESTATVMPTLTSTSQSPQTEESIPTCQNGDNPRTMADLPDFSGTILYTNKNRDRLFILHNHPVQSVEMRMPAPGINRFAFSSDGTGILAYAYNPQEIQKSGKYPIWLISEEGEVSKIELDMNAMDQVAAHTFSDLVSLQRWTFTWVNDHIVKVDAEYGETSKIELGNNLYGFYDILTKTWWEEPIQNLPLRQSYRWIDVSPDLSHLLYVDEHFNLLDWDIDQQRSTWTKSITPFIQIPPYAQWSKDSKNVVFTTLPEYGSLYLLSQDGGSYKSVRELLFSSVKENFVSHYFRWSPDNRLLAMSGTVYNENDGSERAMLYIYNTVTDEYIFRCLLGATSGGSSGMDILWSPDGNYILPMASFEDKIPFRLFDLKSKLVYQIAGDGYAAFGWADQFPAHWK